MHVKRTGTGVSFMFRGKEGQNQNPRNMSDHITRISSTLNSNFMEQNKGPLKMPFLIKSFTVLPA